jgi:hypothetical protein
MTRTLKALGLALLAVCAIGVVTASSASAAKDIITCTNQANCDVTAEKKSGTTTVFGTKGSLLEVTCTGESFAATTVANGAENITVTPTYSGCRAEPFGAATVDMNGCDYLLTGTTTTSKTTNGTEDRTTAPVDIGGTCTEIVITAPGCEIGVTKQSNLHGLTFTNEGATGTTENVKVTAHVDNIHYTTNDTVTCTLASLGPTGTDGFLTGTAIAKGYESDTAHGTANHVGLFADTV